MKWSDVGAKVAEFAPLLGAALGGPGGAALGSLVASALGGDPNDPKAIHAAIVSNPEAALKLREIEARNRERLEELAVRRYEAELQAETSRHESSQATIREEMKHGNDYVKETRPLLARLSGYATVGYLLAGEAARMISSALGMPLDGASETIALSLFAPCGTYMTMRTFDSFSAKGRT